jgi:hypothetical protein
MGSLRVISLGCFARRRPRLTEISFMLHRSAFGWLLASAFCASVSCGGGHNSAAPQGFGLPCKANKDCSTYSLLCGTEQKCVECLGDAICKTGEVCSAGLCTAEEECSDSRDCSGVQVCDEDAGVCVDCLTSLDCQAGQKCSSNTCSDRPTCQFTSDCDDGLVCLVKPGVCVTCRTDDDCGVKRVCEDYECVAPKPAGSGGSDSGGSASGGKSNAAGSGGKATAGAAGTFTGGVDAGGKAGVGGMSGSAGSIGEGGAGGGGVDCGCLVTQTCTPDVRCVAPTLIDDLFDCDNVILAIEGRKGNWAADADLGISMTYGFTDPGATWANRTCAAWASGSELTLNNPEATFAFIGFLLNADALDEGLAYDLSQYSGIQIALETKAATPTSVQVVLKTTGGGYFQYTLTPANGATYLRSAPFTSMSMMANSVEYVLDPSTINEIQFSVVNPKAFAFAIHNVSLY